MSDDGPEWFAPKRYGYGTGIPISWQGWVLSIAFVASLIGLTTLLKNRPVELMAIAVPLVTVFITVAARTTRGGWRWRWGDED